jgi:hypothetical protein
MSATAADLSTPIYDEVVRDLGLDPLDPEHAMHDDFNLASQYHAKAQEDLTTMARSAYLTQ